MTEIQHGGPELTKTTRIADIVGVGLPALVALGPFDPKDEVHPTSKRGVRGPYRHAADVDAVLDPFTADALAGVPDRMLAQRAGLSSEQVKQWRRRRRIAGRRGRPPPMLGTHFMLSSLLAEPSEPMQQAFSPTHGEWRPPAYALRRPLRFDLFARMIASLVDQYSVDQIAHGFGFEQRDVELALVLWTERGTT